jgi:hypothetical protein
MKIDPTGSPIRLPAARRREKTGAAAKSGFARELEGDAAKSASSIGAASPIQAVDAVLALQEVRGESAGRRRAILRGEELLDQLEEIRHGLLSGTLSRRRLIDLRRIVENERDRVDDPQLADILDWIDLRAAVELAKYDGA